MQQAGYHHASLLAEQLRTTIDGQEDEMLAMLQEITASNPAEDSQRTKPLIPQQTQQYSKISSFKC